MQEAVPPEGTAGVVCDTDAELAAAAEAFDEMEREAEKQALAAAEQKELDAILSEPW